MTSCLVKLSQIRDQLKAIDEHISDKELVTIALNRLPPSWSTFASGINAGETPPTFEKLWNACTQEESSLIKKRNESK